MEKGDEQIFLSYLVSERGGYKKDFGNSLVYVSKMFSLFG
jgi:hypothetical protein